MKQFISFVQKEFRHILRDKRTMLILFGMPVVMIILFGFAVTTEVQNVRLAVLDPSNDQATTEIIHELDANKYFDFVMYVHNAEEVNRAFLGNKADIVLSFEENFEQNLLHTGTASIQLLVDGTDPNMCKILVGYVTNILNTYQQKRVTPGKTMIQIIPHVKMLYNPQTKSAYNFVPGVMGLILMLICAMMTSISIVREKETGTMEVLLVSPIKPLYIVFAKMVPYFVLSCINLTTILLLSVYVLGVPMSGNLGLLVTISMLFIVVALSIGLLISTIVDTQVAAMLVSGMVLMLPVILLSGMIYTIESMPLPMQFVSNIIPAKWYILCVKKVMIEGLGIGAVYHEVLILLFMAFVLLTISIKLFKDRLE